jgi:hypothetical protein
MGLGSTAKEDGVSDLRAGQGTRKVKANEPHGNVECRCAAAASAHDSGKRVAAATVSRERRGEEGQASFFLRGHANSMQNRGVEVGIEG